MTEESEEERLARMEKLAALRRYNMKSLGRLVDSNRLTGAARPEPTPPSLPKRSDRPRPDADPVDQPSPGDTQPDEGEIAADRSEDPAVPGGDDVAADGERSGTPDTAPVESAPTSEPGAAPVAGGVDDDLIVSGDLVGPDGVDRSELGGTVTRTGLSATLAGVPERAETGDDTGVDAETDADTDVESAAEPPSLARRMLDGEIGPGGRISDPRDVPGIVLDLAKDVPAAVAVSVVRIDEEVEVVGDTVDPAIDPAIFSSVFSGVFRSVRLAAGALRDGPLGAIQDVVIEGEKMDLVLRPLGDRYYLMLLENRSDPQANLALARMRMASIAPAVAAILAHVDGDA